MIRSAFPPSPSWIILGFALSAGCSGDPESGSDTADATRGGECVSTFHWLHNDAHKVEAGRTVGTNAANVAE